MAAPTARNAVWWHEQDASASADSSNVTNLYARPSVTTGATLPWGGRSNSNLGPPRAFYSGPHSIPTITVTSSQPNMTNFVCKPETSLSPALHSPFADSAAAKDMSVREGATPKAVISRERPGNPDTIETGVRCNMEDHAPVSYSTQGSLQSANTSFAPEATQANGPGQVITTAQDEQGMAMTIGQSPLGGEGSRRAVPHYHMSQAPQQGMLVVTTNASLQAQNAARGDGTADNIMSYSPNADRQLIDTYETDLGMPAGNMSAASPSANDKSYSFFEDMQTHDSLAMETRSSELDAEDDAQDFEAQRRIRRRMNNRESAKRVREKRDADLKAVNEQVVQLQDAQVQLLEHCAQVDANCRDLRSKLQLMRQQLETSNAENLRLRTEVEHLRMNVQVGEPPKVDGIKSEDQEAFQPSTLGLHFPRGDLDDHFGGLVWGQQGFNLLNDQFGQDWRSW